MLTPSNPNGTLLKGIRLAVKKTLTEGDTTSTVTVPGPGLAFYVVASVTANWNLNGWWVSSQTQKTSVVAFSTPAPSGGELMVVFEH